MEHADELGTTDTCARPTSPNSVIGLSLYLVGTPRLTLTPVTPEPGAAAETNTVEWDGRVCVWWDSESHG